MNRDELKHIRLPGIDESTLSPEEAEIVDLVKQVKFLVNPEDYPVKGEFVGRSVQKNPDGSLTVVATGDYYPPRHVCQVCGKLLDASDLLDYVCNQHGGVF
jgi:hypothetical protein